MKISKTFRISNVKPALLALALMMSAADANTVRIFTLSADEWARPRSGAVIPEFGPVRSAVRYWGKGVDAMMVIRHPGEDSGELWAAELRDWLVSLGVPADYIVLVPGSPEADSISLMVGNRDELEL